MSPPDLGAILFTGAFGLIMIGILGIVISTHLVRIVLSIVLLETGANLLLMLSGYRPGAAAPIIIDGVVPAAMVDPVPQALVLTAIVIGVAVQAFMMTLVLRLRSVYGTLDIRELRARLERDLAQEAGIGLPTSDDAPDVAGVGTARAQGGDA
ncbi:MAG TPA: NADH-quinone oxidoreductase subunit K [Gammaproteobacteria bacterium]|nr:NADH-quinone oxidoreductase subunit K [Gammaproteobacteria bacterium]